MVEDDLHENCNIAGSPEHPTERIRNAGVGRMIRPRKELDPQSLHMGRMDLVIGIVPRTNWPRLLLTAGLPQH